MFIIRSLFWLGTLVMLLPPAQSGGLPPRVDLLQAAYAARILLQDFSGICDRNPAACDTSREALALLGRKIETGAGIVSAGIAAGASRQPQGEGRTGALSVADHGSLTRSDLEAPWSAAGS